MKFVVILCATFLALAYANEDFCLVSTKEFCKPESVQKFNCNAKYGGIEHVEKDLNDYATEHIIGSLKYLLLSTFFANYKKERHGFEKLYRKMSDEKWNDAIDLIKHITKRGGTMDMNKVFTKDISYNMTEIESVSFALDSEKKLAKKAMSIHHKITRNQEAYHDPEIGNYLEEEFMEKHAKQIRELSGYGNDLSKILGQDTGHNALSLFLFDEYLSKHL